MGASKAEERSDGSNLKLTLLPLDQKREVEGGER